MPIWHWIHWNQLLDQAAHYASHSLPLTPHDSLTLFLGGCLILILESTKVLGKATLALTAIPFMVPQNFPLANYKQGKNVNKTHPAFNFFFVILSPIFF